MTSKSTIYRRNNPEMYLKQQEAKKVMENNKYKNDPEFREKKKEQALLRYYQKKEREAKIKMSVCAPETQSTQK